MTSTVKWIIALVLIVIIGAGIWWYMGMNSSSTVSNATPTGSGPSAEQSPGVTPSGTLSPSDTTGSPAATSQGAAPSNPAGPTGNSGSAPVTAASASDASLQQDAQSIDAQLGGLNSDSASTNAGLNSQ